MDGRGCGGSVLRRTDRERSRRDGRVRGLGSGLWHRQRRWAGVDRVARGCRRDHGDRVGDGAQCRRHDDTPVRLARVASVEGAHACNRAAACLRFWSAARPGRPRSLPSPGAPGRVPHLSRVCRPRRSWCGDQLQLLVPDRVGARRGHGWITWTCDVSSDDTCGARSCPRGASRGLIFVARTRRGDRRDGCLRGRRRACRSGRARVGVSGRCRD